MSKSTRNSGKHWTPQETKQLEKLADQNTPTRVIGLKLGRSENAVTVKPARKASLSVQRTSRRITGRSLSG